MEHEYNGIGAASCPIYLKADVSCARFSPFRGVCPVVEQTELGLLCLSERGGVPRMCGGAVMWLKEWFFPTNFVNKAIET